MNSKLAKQFSGQNTERYSTWLLFTVIKCEMRELGFAYVSTFIPQERTVL